MKKSPKNGTLVESLPAQSVDSYRNWKRIDGVDLLRGLAIFFVLMNHVNMRLLFAKVPYTQGLSPLLTSPLVWNGQRGVQIFFAVSGFLITSTTLRRWGSPAAVSVRDFYLLRFARIAPLLILLLTVLSILHFLQFKNYVVPARTGGLGRALVAALTFHVNVLEARRGYLPGSWDILWSLSVEEMFYLFFPWVCRLFGRTKLLIAILLAFVVLGPLGRTVFAHGNEVWSEYSYLGSMDAIALGCLTALFLASNQLSPSMLRVIGSIGVAILIFGLGFPIQASKWGMGRTGLDMTNLALGACMVILAATTTQWRSPRWLKPLVALGQRSYEVYLVHMFVVFAMFNLFLEIGRPMAGVPVLFLAVILTAGAFGDLTARFYSEPMNRFLRRRGVNRLGSVLDQRKAG